uniref:Uncharacterized protein n=1 Tax=Arundo donax TaxID=35708 RepID=A0A0A9FDM5_ARUDO
MSASESNSEIVSFMSNLTLVLFMNLNMP